MRKKEKLMERRMARGLAAVAVAVLLVAAPSAAAKKKGAKQGVSGKVMDRSGEALRDVQVKLVAAAGGVELAGTTDKKGEFEIAVETAGDYVLSFEKEGFTPFDTTLNLIADEWQSVEVQLLDAAQGQRNAAIAAYNAGAEAFRQRDLATAKQHFLTAIEVDPELPEPYLALADIHLTDGEYAEAAAAAEKFLAQRPDDQQARVIAYEAYVKTGEAKKAEAMRAALAQDPALAKKLAVQMFNEGAHADQAGDRATAEEKFRAALELDPTLVQAHAGLAAVYFNQERFDQALAELEKVLELDPGNAQARRVRFLVHDARGDQEAANAAIDAYIEVDPEGGVDLLYKRADLDFRGGEPDLARAALVKILEIDPDMPRAHYTLGLIYASTDVAKAKEHLRKFIELAPEDPEAAAAREMLDQL